jgi:cellulose synthase/poly-beta-1,6-N-acetylglucosamine synthase-like glycosyltransferase
MTEKLLGIFFITALVCIGLMTGMTLDFIFFYPLFMSVIWIVGGVYFYYHWERQSPGPSVAPKLKEYPFASIVIPCHNEGPNDRSRQPPALPRFRDYRCERRLDRQYRRCAR